MTKQAPTTRNAIIIDEHDGRRLFAMRIVRHKKKKKNGRINYSVSFIELSTTETLALARAILAQNGARRVSKRRRTMREN